MASYLDELVAGAHARVAATLARTSIDEVRARAELVQPPPSFRAALQAPGVAVIAEIKRASPSRGVLAPDVDAVALARAYSAGGAAAISVLTEPERFGGSLDDLAAVAATGAATLRKDFIVHPLQVWEAREVGASAVLLIVAALGGEGLRLLLDACDQAGLDALVEVHDGHEAQLAVDTGASIVGVNARDLTTFELDRTAFARIRPTLGAGVIAVAESGVRGPEDVVAVAREGADAVLVGEALVTAGDPRAAVAALVDAGAPAAVDGR